MIFNNTKLVSKNYFLFSRINFLYLLIASNDVLNILIGSTDGTIYNN